MENKPADQGHDLGGRMRRGRAECRTPSTQATSQDHPPGASLRPQPLRFYVLKQQNELTELTQPGSVSCVSSFSGSEFISPPVADRGFGGFGGAPDKVHLLFTSSQPRAGITLRPQPLRFHVLTRKNELTELTQPGSVSCVSSFSGSEFISPPVADRGFGGFGGASHKVHLLFTSSQSGAGITIRPQPLRFHVLNQQNELTELTEPVVSVVSVHFQAVIFFTWSARNP